MRGSKRTINRWTVSAQNNNEKVTLHACDLDETVPKKLHVSFGFANVNKRHWMHTIANEKQLKQIVNYASNDVNVKKPGENQTTGTMNQRQKRWHVNSRFEERSKLKPEQQSKSELNGLQNVKLF